MKRINALLIKICIVSCLLGGMLIFTRMITRAIVVLGGVDNAFTKAVFFDQPLLAEPISGDVAISVGGTTIDWENKYPFSESSLSIEEIQENAKISEKSRYLKVVDGIKSSIDYWANDIFMLRMPFIEAKYSYDNFIGWNLVAYSAYNDIAKMTDGYLTSYMEEVFVENQAEALVELNDYCQEERIEFLYIQAPSKISKYQDLDISGIIDFSNQNVDELLKLIKKENVNFLDLRTVINEKNIEHHSLFYKTDHHWKPETGLWITGILAETLNRQYNYNIDTTLYDEKMWEKEVYTKWFLGSEGKQVTLAKTEPDDFTLLYPDFKTSLLYKVPGLSIEKEGAFDITYDMGEVEIKDFYNKNPYGAYNYGDNALICFENKLECEDIKVLLIKDSFGNCVAPFLSLGVEKLDILDLRYFNGSVKAYIEKEKPDLVIVLYNPGAIDGKIDYDSHKSLFDFR